MPQPLLSVCLITYNHENYIRQAIEGVLMQQVNFEWEFIIAEDYSTDGTRKIVEEYYAKYPVLIKPILQEKNVGPARNFIDLFSSAKGKYIAYIEGDDYWTDPNKLQKQVDFLEANPDYSICFTNAIIKDEIDGYENRAFISNKTASDFSLETLLQENFIPMLTVMYRGNLINRMPEWYINANPGDWPLHIFYAQYGKIGYLENVSAVYRKHRGGIHSGAEIEKKYVLFLEMLNNLKSIIEPKYFQLLSRTIAFNRRALGKLQIKNGKLLMGLHNFFNR